MKSKLKTKLLENFLLQMTSDLRDFSNLLTKVGVMNVGPLLSVMNSTRQGTDAFGEFAYRCKNFEISLDNKLKGIYPNVKTIKLNLDLDIKLKENQEYIEIASLNSNITLSGIRASDGIQVLSAYHIDRHIEGGNPSLYPHPLIHFHFGGDKLERDKCNNMLFLDSPRLPCLPMELFLTMDFILSNFCPQKWKSLQQECKYLAIQGRYQKIFWQPWIETLNQHFNPTTISNSVYKAHQLIPQIIS